MKTKREILDETCAAYTRYTRCVNYNTSTCAYFRDGLMCAVGRCMVDPYSVQRDHPGEPVWLIRDLDSKLKPEYRGHEVEFWKRLQVLHDTGVYWDESGLTAAGVAERSLIEEAWCHGE